MAKEDLLYTLRSLARAKSFTLVAVLSIGLGCAAATVIFSLVNGIILKPLGYRDPDRLVFLRQTWPATAALYPQIPVNMQHFLYWRAHAKSFESMAALRGSNAILTGRGDAETIDTVQASSGLFRVLGVEPVLGRGFTEGDDQPGRAKVAVITDSLYRRRFGGAPGAINTQVLLDGTPYQLIGVLPSSFRFPRSDDLGALAPLGKNPEIFLPLVLQQNDDWGGDFDYSVIARLAGRISHAQAISELNVLEAQIETAHRNPAGVRAIGILLQDQITTSVRTGLWVLLAAVSVLILIVCVNLANLMYARVHVRSREFSIRTALGAGRGRIVWQILTETLLVGIAGACLGLAMATATVRAFVANAPVNLPRLDEVASDWRVLLFACGIAVVCGLLSGVIPALRIARQDPQDALKSSGHTSSGSRRDIQVREVLVGCEVALSAILLVCAGLLLGSLRNVLRIDRGFGVERAITFPVHLDRVNYKKPADAAVFYDRLLAALESIPGVHSAAYISRLPLTGESQVNDIVLEGASRGVMDRGTNQVLMVNVRDASPDYFRAMAIPLLKGRVFEGHDRGRAVALVSGRLAAKLWPDENPLGKRFSTGSGVGKVEVVGVVEDVHNAKLEQSPTLVVYVPYWRNARLAGDIVLRTAIDPPALMPEVGRRVRALDPGVPVGQFRTIEELVADATAQRRFQMEIVVGFASAALLVALIGIYGVVAFTAAQRRFEMGVRAALGARPRDILGLMAVSGLRPVVCGLAVGLGGAALLGRLLRALLFGVSPVDGTTMVVVAALLVLAGGVACWLPGRSVSRVDPARVLRYE